MLHIFISYSHKDISYLNVLVKFLKNEGFQQDKDIWFDKYIGAGDDWREKIEQAINDSYCLISIVTNNSLASPICIYEWAYALGYGVPVIPMIFQEGLTHNQIHQPLSRQNGKHMNGELIESLKQLRIFKPEQVAIGRKLYQATHSFRVMARLCCWIGRMQDKLEDCDRELVENVIDYTTDITQKTMNEDFLDLFLQYQSSMTNKQQRYAREIMSVLQEFWHKFWSISGLINGTWLRGSEVDFDELENFRVNEVETTLAKLFEFDDTSEDDFFRYFERLLDCIEKGEPLRQVPFMSLSYVYKSVTNSISEELRAQVVNCIESSYKSRIGDFHGGMMF